MKLAPVGELSFPKATAAVIAWKLQCLARWPEVAQLKLNEQRRVYDLRFGRQQDTIEALVEARLDEPAGVTYFTVAVVAGGALLLGIIAGGAAVLLVEASP